MELGARAASAAVKTAAPKQPHAGTAAAADAAHWAPSADLWTAFSVTATRRAAAPALIFANVSVSFSELHRLALRAAAYLTSLGVGRGDVVALQLTKRPQSYALMLACLRLGAIYVCLDPKNPPSRTQRIMAQIAPRVLFTEPSVTRDEPAAGCQPAPSLNVSDWPAAASEDGLENRSAGDAPAYLMFTSGSTGEPKGAVIPQMGIISLMKWCRALLGDADQHRFTGINPLHFDNSVFDFYCGLVSGATLVPVETSQVVNPLEWAQYVTEKSLSDILCKQVNRHRFQIGLGILTSNMIANWLSAVFHPQTPAVDSCPAF